MPSSFPSQLILKYKCSSHCSLSWFSICSTDYIYNIINYQSFTINKNFPWSVNRTGELALFYYLYLDNWSEINQLKPPLHHDIIYLHLKHLFYQIFTCIFRSGKNQYLIINIMYTNTFFTVKKHCISVFCLYEVGTWWPLK